jgi:phage baseplate assembly protein W
MDNQGDVIEVTAPSLTYRVINGRIAGMVDGQDAARQAIDKILRTERFVWPIYDDQYGNDLAELLGKEMPYVKAEVRRMLVEALKADDRVNDVQINKIEQTGSDELSVFATVTTQFGLLNIESEVTT